MKVRLIPGVAGEFDLTVSVWLIDPDDPEDNIDVIYETDNVEDAMMWCKTNAYEVVSDGYGSGVAG